MVNGKLNEQIHGDVDGKYICEIKCRVNEIFGFI